MSIKADGWKYSLVTHTLTQLFTYSFTHLLSDSLDTYDFKLH